MRRTFRTRLRGHLVATLVSWLAIYEMILHVLGMNRVVHGPDFPHHSVVIAVETGHFIAANRVLDCVNQASVAIGAGAWRQILALLEVFNQVVVGDQGTGDSHAVAVTIGNRFPDIGSLLEATSAEDGDLDGLLNLASIAEAYAL